MRWFHKIGNPFDPAPIVKELMQHPLLWGKSPRVTFPGSPHQDAHDIVLRGPIGLEYKTLQELHVELQCEDYTAGALLENTLLMANNLAYLLSSDEMRHLDSPLRLGRVILTRLEPMKTIWPHKDEGPVPAFYRRFHLCVQGGEENVRVINGEVVRMMTGDMWEADVREMHTVINLMERDRIHLIVDIER